MGAISFSIDEKLLAFLTRELPLKVFVETGTFKGDSLEIARRFFERAHSVEASPELHQQAQARFQAEKDVHLHLGDSPSFLRKHQKEFAAEATLFWMDAHWCNADKTSGENSQSPLLGELAAIGSLHRDSVLLVDDARLYLCAPPAPHRFDNWPDLHAIFSALLKLSESHRLLILNDVLIYHPGSLQAEMAKFAHKHGTDWLLLAMYARLAMDAEAVKEAARKRAAQRPLKRAEKALRRYFKKKE
jgi:hypothetical protein